MHNLCIDKEDFVSDCVVCVVLHAAELPYVLNDSLYAEALSPLTQ